MMNLFDYKNFSPRKSSVQHTEKVNGLNRSYPHDEEISLATTRDDIRRCSSSDEETQIPLELDEGTQLTRSLDLQKNDQPQEDFSYFVQLAEKNNPRALVQLFYIYCDEEDVEMDYQKAMECFKKIEALATKNPSIYDETELAVELAYIHNTVGQMYYLGLGVEEDLSEAKRHFEIAAKSELPEAYDCLKALHQHSTSTASSKSNVSEFHC